MAYSEQHYEVSTAFIMSCLGPHMKYSSCLFPTGKETLEEAEVLMFEDYCKKAKLEDGMDVLDLGCVISSLTDMSWLTSVIAAQMWMGFSDALLGSEVPTEQDQLSIEFAFPKGVY